ncbi:hypothetical protein B0H10DRAFT_1783433 [Mycena sp. CBHHK59/15]|nr:hypothetical protein B0H10DRAFT_1783433 [Mycena sp. CBHHK59/15]
MSSTAPVQTQPWAPFQTYGDFKFAARHIQRRTPNSQIDEDLEDLHDGSFSTDSLVTFRNHRDMERALAAVQVGNVPVSFGSMIGIHLSGTYEVGVEFWDPWHIIMQWVSDPTLAAVSTWYSQEKYLCLNGEIDFSDPLYDELWTGKKWQRVDDDLPSDSHYPSCFLGLHTWLDKGLITTKVKMHPILLCACWIESVMWNGSGNGGSALVGFVKMPENMRQIDPSTLSSSARAEYDRLKQLIYHGVCKKIMASLRECLHQGEALRFGGGVTQVAHPGILIESMDFEELAAWLCICNSCSNHPCPKCLVHHDDLHRLTCSYPPRTTEMMCEALSQAPTSSRTARNDFLKGYGLHDFEHFLWTFAHSDPYEAADYDCLLDGGIWRHHMWVLLKTYLQDNGLASTFNTNMGKFPRWHNLKHESSPTTIDFSDGQTFLDILKHCYCALNLGHISVPYCPPNSCLVKLIRVMEKVRVMLGLDVMTASRLEVLRKFITDYERICKDVSQKHNKSLDFLKQHFLSHAIDNFRAKGTSKNMNTWVREGLQQEVSAQYAKTNGKNAEHQIPIMDEREEAMARIQMAVDAWLESQVEDEKTRTLEVPMAQSTAHWKLGAAEA